MKDLMIHVEKAVRPLRITQGRRGAIREELLAHLTGIYEEELARHDGNQDAAVAAAIRRFGPASEITEKLRESLPWYSAVLSCIPFFARVRSWPESMWRIAWRGWITGILAWVLVGIPWCGVLIALGRKSVAEALTLWCLLAALGIAMLVPFVGMVGSLFGVYGLSQSKLRTVLFGMVGCASQLAVYLMLQRFVSPSMPLATYAIPFIFTAGTLAAAQTHAFATLIRQDTQRAARVGEWEQLAIDE